MGAYTLPNGTHIQALHIFLYQTYNKWCEQEPSSTDCNREAVNSKTGSIDFVALIFVFRLFFI